MAYVNEYISEADLLEYEIEKVNQRFNRFDYKPHWTRDAERDRYLRKVAQGREEFSNITDFTFHWRRTLYVARLLKASGGVRGGEGWLSYELKELSPEPEGSADREQLLADMKEALIAYGAGGVFADMTVTKFSFDF